MNVQPDHTEIEPMWKKGKHIDSRLFCDEFLRDHPLRYVGNRFFTVDGVVPTEAVIQKMIYEKLRPWYAEGLPKKTDAMLDCLRMECYTPEIPIQTDRIHVSNGTYCLDGHFSEEKEFCLNRLPVRYDPDAETPVKWLAFLNDLLMPEDILTLQEYIGYCLIPSTKAQKMLFLVGKGGEGKSRVGVVLRALFGAGMNTGSLYKVEENRFARADLEYALLMVDDDMKLEALPQTNVLKSIVTAELPMDLEKKGQQSYQGRLYVRFLAFGNGTMRAQYDRSVGFFRRQLILTVRDKPENRVDDPYLAEKMTAEAEGIFLWALEGLKRLKDNNFRFTESEKVKETMEESVRDANNIIDFLASEGYFRFKADFETTTKELYELYRVWCTDNVCYPLSGKVFSDFLSRHADEYRLEATNNVYRGKGKRCRGYLGIEILLNQNEKTA